MPTPEAATGFVPDWPAPDGVGAWMSTRAGGVSAAPWASLNLGVAVGDAPAAVAENRRRFAAALGARPVFLRQVHGDRVLRLDASLLGQDDQHAADAAVCTEPGIACTVQVADCLPVLFAVRDGSAVAAAHAGWRGLAGGVLERTVDTLCEAAGCTPDAVVAWLGPCIGPAEFEVGAEVVEAFGDAAGDQPTPRFVPRRRADGSLRWLAHLPRLAHERLRRRGVAAVSGGGACTVADGSRFFSYRRDGVTGRLAAAVWRR